MKASDDVKFLINNENKNKYIIENAIYEKNNETIKTENNSKARYQDDKIITAKIFNHDIKNNILKITECKISANNENNIQIYKNAIYEKNNETIKTEKFKSHIPR